MDRSGPKDWTRQVFKFFKGSSNLKLFNKKIELSCGKCETYADSLCLSAFFASIKSTSGVSLPTDKKGEWLAAGVLSSVG
jgi:hypothetical protein